MKRTIITCAIVVIFGILIALGQFFIFKICSAAGCCTTTACSYSSKIILAMGMLTAALGFCMPVYNENKTQLGLTIAIAAAAIVVLLTIHVTVGGCNNLDMSCRKVTFPALTIICSVLLAGCAANVFLLQRKSHL
jgi:hypothetical protein